MLYWSFIEEEETPSYVRLPPGLNIVFSDTPFFRSACYSKHDVANVRRRTSFVFIRMLDIVKNIDCMLGGLTEGMTRQEYIEY